MASIAGKTVAGLIGLGMTCIAVAALAASPDAPPESSSTPSAVVTPEDWSTHFQLTVVGQGYPGFPSTVKGPNSLPAHGQIRETISGTAFLGARLPWSGGELYFDPEFNQGFGVGRTLGIDGFVNGEAQKAGFETPKLNVARLFLRQTFGLGGPQETLAPDANQLGESVDIARLTVTAGKMAVSDLFDDNQYAHDPRTTFLNWSLWESGAWDYPADQKGYTDGLAAELNAQDWALRGGWFLEPKVANGRDLEPRFWKRFGAVVELETRHEWLGQPGKLRYLVFANRADMGNPAQAAELAVATGTPADIAALRHDSWKLGAALNLEQSLSADLGLFSRLSWNDGHTEGWAFTDIDRSAVLGLSLKGASWGRPDDTVALAGAVNGLSKAHQLLFANGGTGILAGDGSLNYAPEGIIESYYSARAFEPLWLTIDYQLVANPAFNQDRGPVHVFALRAHLEF